MTRTKTKTAAQDATLLPAEGTAAVPAMQDAKTVALAQADPIFAIIERLAKDATFDVDKMERLINMHERAKAGNARAEFDRAMSLAQQEMMAIRTNAKSDKGKYANYAALDKAIRPVYTKHGFSISFDTDPGAPELTVRLVATVAHSGGHRERRQLDVPADGKGAKGGDVMTKTHATASAITYGKRYLSSMIWNLAVDHDDDGNAAGDRGKAYADAAIEYLNTAKLDKAALTQYRAEREKDIAWLKKHTPDQFERFQQAYSNAAEAAGIKKEEPRRGTQAASPSPATPQRSQDDGDGGQSANAAEAGGGPTASSGQPADQKPGVTDLEEVPPEHAQEGQKLVFANFAKVSEFCDFADPFLERTNAEGARQFGDYYEGMLLAMEKGKPKAQAAAKDYRKIIADKTKDLPPREPGQEG